MSSIIDRLDRRIVKAIGICLFSFVGLSSTSVQSAGIDGNPDLEDANPVVISPAVGSTLTGTSATFSWNNNGVAVTDYWVYAGTAARDRSFYDSGNIGASTTTEVTGLPTDGSSVVVTLWYNVAGTWLWSDFTYTADTVNPPTITSPVDMSTLGGDTQKFEWSDNGSSVTNYWLYLGSSMGGRDIYDSGDLGMDMDVTVSGLPVDSSAIYATLFYKFSGDAAWYSTTGTYYASSAGFGFYEDFSTDISNWDQNRGTWSHTGGNWLYAGDDNAPSMYAIATYKNAQYKNFGVSARVWRQVPHGAAPTALIFRASGDGFNTDGLCSNCYFVQIDTELGRFGVWKTVNGSWSSLQHWTSSAAVKKGNTWNDITVQTNEGAMVLFINGEIVWAGYDTSHSEGKVGVGAYKYPYKNLQLWVDSVDLYTFSPSAMEAEVASAQQDLNAAANLDDSAAAPY